MRDPIKEGVCEVLSPVGEENVGVKTLAPRLDTLNGKTICEAWNGMFTGWWTFPRIRELLKKQYPDVKFVSYSELPLLDTHKMEEVLGTLASELKQKGCDALITGNGC